MTRWSTSMILESVRDGHGMTCQALDRAVVLAELGLIDISGVWRLTPAGEARIAKPYDLQPARYAKGQNLIRPDSDGGTKSRAERLLCALRCRYTNRESGYVVSPSKTRRFEQLFAEGWDANFFSNVLIAPEVKP